MTTGAGHHRQWSKEGKKKVHSHAFDLDQWAPIKAAGQLQELAGMTYGEKELAIPEIPHKAEMPVLSILCSMEMIWGKREWSCSGVHKLSDPEPGGVRGGSFSRNEPLREGCQDR